MGNNRQSPFLVDRNQLVWWPLQKPANGRSTEKDDAPDWVSMEVTWSSKMLATYHINIQCHNPEDCNLPLLYHENFKSHHYINDQSVNICYN